MKRKKHLLVTIDETNGDKSYNHDVLITIGQKASAERAADRVARDWYECEPEDRERTKERDTMGEGYLFFGGEIHVGVHNVREVPPEDYAVLSKYMSVL